MYKAPARTKARGRTGRRTHDEERRTIDVRIKEISARIPQYYIVFRTKLHKKCSKMS